MTVLLTRHMLEELDTMSTAEPVRVDITVGGKEGGVYGPGFMYCPIAQVGRAYSGSPADAWPCLGRLLDDVERLLGIQVVMGAVRDQQGNIVQLELITDDERVPVMHKAKKQSVAKKHTQQRIDWKDTD